MNNEKILKTDGLKKHYGEVKAVDGINMEIEKGEVIPLCGANGAGKTTLIDLLTGLREPDEGSIYIEDEEITGLTTHDRVKKGILKTFQLEHEFDHNTVLDTIRIATFSKLGKHYNFFRNIENYKDITEEAEQLLEEFELAELKNQSAHDISHGDKKILDIASTFPLNPKILLIDEPTSGVSEEDKYDMMRIILDRIEKEGIAAVVVEHDLELVRDLFDYTVIMHEGQFIAEDSTDNVFEKDEVIDVLVGRGM